MDHGADLSPELSTTLGECRGCHTSARSTPPSRFSIGLGRWRDEQCFGCHAEIDDVATRVRAGVNDRRFMGLPVSRERVLDMAAHPLSYLRAPEGIGAVEHGVQRIAPERLGAFLRRPAAAGPRAEHPDAMMAFPALPDADAERLLGVLEGPAHPPVPRARGDRRKAEGAWRALCAACHASVEGPVGRTPAYLALFTADWIFTYATTQVTVGPRPRRMPTFTLDRATAEGLHALFGDERRRREIALDDAVARMRRRPPAVAPSRKAMAAIGGAVVDALRAGRCVHCHTGNNRPRRLFEATPEGLRAYATRRGGLAIWERLETRVLEVEAGLSAARPGMPMTAPPLPRAMRDRFLRWALAGCPDRDGESACLKRPAGTPR